MTTLEPSSLTLTEIWSSRVRGGVPEIPLVELSEPPSAEPGDVVQLRAENFEPIGWAIVDPPRGVLWVYPATSDAPFDEKFLRRRVHQAFSARGRMGLTGDSAGYRLLHGEGDGLAGFQADVYAQHVVLYSLSEALDRHAPLLASVISKEIHPKSIISKVRPVGESQAGKIPFRIEFGEEPPPAVMVTEGDLQYEVHLTGGLNTGLFLDMRQVRQALRPWLRGKSVLNLFSYTGAFSMLAAREGARSITSVDFAQGVLEWTKANFAHNNIPLNKKIRFERDDVFEYLKVNRRHEKQYDVIILDPPAKTFVPGKRWFLKSDYGRLIAHALKVLSPGGVLVVAASCASSRPEKLETQIREAARETQRRLRLVDTPGLPIDFPTQMIHPAARYLKCLILWADLD